MKKRRYNTVVEFVGHRPNEIIPGIAHAVNDTINIIEMEQVDEASEDGMFGPPMVQKSLVIIPLRDVSRVTSVPVE